MVTTSPRAVSPNEDKPTVSVQVSSGVTSTKDPSPGQGQPESQVAELQRQRREKEPLFYCKIITKYPKTAFGITLGGHILMLAITQILFAAGYDILPIQFEDLPLNIRDNDYFLRGLAWDERNNGSGYFERGASGETQQEERSQSKEKITWIFQEKGGNVLTQQNLQLMKEVEDKLFQMTEYQESFCKLSNNSCVKPKSMLRFFDGTYEEVNPIFNDPNFNNVVNVVYSASYHNETKMKLAYHLGIGSKVTMSKAEAEIIRAYMVIGFPLEGFSTDEDRVDKQEDLLKTFMKDTLLTNAQNFFEHGVGNMNFIYNSPTFLQIYISSLVFKDLTLIVGSFSFIFLFMWFQTGSLWITWFAIFSIITGFCATNLVYRVILDFRYFGIFHVLALFIILGIGADDVFVFFDTWKESCHHQYISLAHRLSDCYRRASLAMMYTSLTTAVAFVVSATSPFLSVESFGVFSGLLVVMNYISVITYFPCVVVMYHTYFDKYKCCCCGMRKTYVVDVTSKPDHEHRKNIFVHFFRGPYYRFVTHKILRWVILGFYAVVLAVFIYFASTLKVNEEQLKFLPDETNTGQFVDIHANRFDTGDRPVRVYIIFGLKNQDLSDCHRSDDLCYGNVVWDEDFNLNSAEAQQGFLDICNSIKNLNSEEAELLKIKKSLMTDQWEVQCFLEDMEMFFENSMLDVNFPFDESDAQTVMTSNPVIYNPSLLPSGYTNWLEISLSYWLYNGFDLADGIPDDFSAYNPVLGEGKLDTTITKDIPLPGGGTYAFEYGTELKYAAIIVNTTLNPRTLGFLKGSPVRDEWESFISQQCHNRWPGILCDAHLQYILLSKQLEDKPEVLKNGFQTTPSDYWGENLWHWLQIQETLVTSAVIGIAVGLCLALPILIIATMNVITGVLATLTICCVTVSVIGVLPLAGWKLGLLESLNMVLVVGLAVDYCVHLAEGYSRSESSNRLGRVHTTLEEVGISVISGSCSTLGASFFMIFGQILFFSQFGIVMFCTIGFSLLYALGLFVTVLGILGPQNETGSLRPLWRKLKACLIGEDKKSDTGKEENPVSSGYTNGVHVLNNESNNCTHL